MLVIANSRRRQRCRSCLTRPKTRVLKAALEHLGGRCAINSVNYEDGDGTESRSPSTRGRRAPPRRRSRPSSGLSPACSSRSIRMCRPRLVFHISFGLNPAARQVLNSVFLPERQGEGLGAHRAQTDAPERFRFTFPRQQRDRLLLCIADFVRSRQLATERDQIDVHGACPNLEDRTNMMELLEPGRIGVTLSEELQLHPSSPPTRSCCTIPRPSTSTPDRR